MISSFAVIASGLFVLFWMVCTVGVPSYAFGLMTALALGFLIECPFLFDPISVGSLGAQDRFITRGFGIWILKLLLKRAKIYRKQLC